MKLEFWHERWEKNEIGFHQEETNAHLQQYWHRLDIQKGGRAFVPLCGKSRDMLWILSQGHPVTGVEVSSLGVESFINENNLKAIKSEENKFTRWKCDSLEILCGDFFDLQPDDLDGISGIYDRASLVALPPDMREQYAKHLLSILPRASRMLLLTFEYEQEEMQGPPFSVHEEEVNSLYGPHFAIEKLYEKETLGENQRFRERGLTSLTEKIYLLTRT